MTGKFRPVFHASGHPPRWPGYSSRRKTPSILHGALQSGTSAALATAAVAAIAGKCETGSFAAPLNATSHILWGEEAARQDKFSFRYTLAGFLLNHGASIFWASIYERRMRGGRDDGRRRRISRLSPDELGPAGKPLAEAAGVTAAAYLIDYHVIPKRFTPGFERRLSGKSLCAIFAALAIGLAARDVLDGTRRR